MTRIAFLGVGHLAEAMIEGFLRDRQELPHLALSPRGHGPKLAKRHGLELAERNDALVSGSDIVFLATRPGDAIAAISNLPWRPEHILVSACAGVPLAQLERAAAPARVMRIMPLTAASLGASPTTAFPSFPEVHPLLARLGPVIALENEAQFETATVSAAIYGWVQSLIGLGRDWSVAHGMSPEAARQLAATTFVAAGRMIAERPEPVETLIANLATPGGITERGLAVLSEHGVQEGWTAACDAVLAKLMDGSAGRCP
ncbi:pyrroline-5-carboxylate reductase family protein [Bosea sp. 2KB_26]|uniref:pyrroline-5-carboxylate reductase family protein n=1 Tax=Bosea sp. 2KB_26 TaxID=3237475 RepID=UPI003F8E0227